MAAGTRFYILAAVGTLVISLALLVMNRFDWYARRETTRLLTVQLPADRPFDRFLDDLFLTHTDSAELVSAESVRGGALVELVYGIRLKKGSTPQDILDGARSRNGNNKVAILTGYDSTDL